MSYDKNINSRSNVAPSVVGKKRTRFSIGGTRRFTCNTGDYVPWFCKEVLPGDTFDMKSATLTRLETSLHQVMDNAYLELAYFYVPNRIIMDDWDKLLGANDDPWARTTEVVTPCIKLSSDAATVAGVVTPQSLLNQLMLPAGDYLTQNQFNGLTDAAKERAMVTLLPLRATLQIYNDWFRDENIDSVIAFSKGNNDIWLSNAFTFNGANFFPRKDTLKVNRFRDRFSSALPAPQKGAAVSFSLGTTAPVMAGGLFHSMGNPIALGDGNAVAGDPGVLGLSTASADAYNIQGKTGNVEVQGSGYAVDFGNDATDVMSYSNLYTDLSTATAITVNDLRLAIAAQVLSEQEARGGTRLTEVLFSQWNIKAPSLMVDRSEYLGGRRIPLQMLEVLQTSESTDTAVLGEDAGHGKTFDGDSGSAFKGFLFHGYVIGVAFIRTARSYSQGIDRQFFRRGKYTYFNPIFDNIGEVPVYGEELFVPTFKGDATGYSSAYWNRVFGYQEAWYEYKEGMNRDSGYMQAGITGTLDTWHYGDDYTDHPLLSQTWLKESATNVDRTIAVSSTSAHQWSLMISTECYATRQMAKYSVPNAFGFGSK